MVKKVASGEMDPDEAQRLIESGFEGNVRAMNAYLKSKRTIEDEELCRQRFKIGGQGPSSPPGPEPDGGEEVSDPEEEEDGEPEQSKSARKRFRRRGRFGDGGQ
jgi:hypothetical protein